MNHPILIRHGYDPTGTSLDNLVSQEVHELSDKRFRAISPHYGVFFTEGFQIQDSMDSRFLIRGEDYVFAELHQSLSLKLGKEVSGIVIVTNKKVSSRVTISYQCVGGHYSSDNSTLISLLNKTADNAISGSFDDIKERPVTFTPTAHMHDLGDLSGAEALLYEIERIRNAIFWSDSGFSESLMGYVKDYIDNITRHIVMRANTEYMAMVIEYKTNFNKITAGLGSVQNYAPATAQDSANAYSDSYQYLSKHNDKYVITETITAFKEVVYSNMVSNSTTGLGRPYGRLSVSTMQALSQMPQGSTVLLDNQRSVRLSGVAYDPVVYPNNERQLDSWTIHKATNKSNGSILMAVNNSTGQLYSGLLNVSQNSTITLKWSRYLNDGDTNGLMSSFLSHLQENANPHRTNKNSIGLGKVENLPIATKEDIICRTGARKYVTYDMLLLFAKAFMTGVKSEDDLEDPEDMQSVTEQYQTIFSPCGPCGTLQKQLIEVPVHDPAGPILTFCTEEGNKMILYSDGNGGTYAELIEASSPSCGHTAPPEPPEEDLTLGWSLPGVDEEGQPFIEPDDSADFTNPQWDRPQV